MAQQPNKLTKKVRKILLNAAPVKRRDEGFTLIELLIVITVVPIIIFALTSAMMAAFTLQSSVSSRLTDSGDAQVVTASYQNDVQSAAVLTTQPSSPLECGTGTQLLGLEWDINSQGTYETTVSYVTAPVSGSSASELVRQYCTDGSLTPESSTVLSYSVTAAQTVPTVTCTATASTCDSSTQWISTNNVLTVKFDVTEPQSKYEYTLLAVPAQSAAQQPAGSPIVNTTTTQCNFATPNTGTYASTLCFVNFALLNNTQNMLEATSGCLEVSVALPNNYTLYFCVGISGSPIKAVAFPTYSDAFLGNSINGTPFYIGVAGDPALYQYQSGSLDTISITNIVVDNPVGAPATGWEAVGADAETTDPGEYITYTSDKDLNLLDNTPTSPMGDACNEPDSSGNPGPGGTDLTGVGTTTVTCASTWQAGVPRTGADMVWATTPSTLTATMQGSGLQGFSLGLLLS
jgi:prepilin-type N-terminal cleavage/methylation domain-containing protein